MKQGVSYARKCIVKPMKLQHHQMIAFFGAVAEPGLSQCLISKVHFLASSLVFVLTFIDRSYLEMLGLQIVQL